MKQNEQSHQNQFSNPICKSTYNSLPKIYGGNHSKRESNRKKQSSTNIVKKHQCSNSHDNLQSLVKKKPMKFNFDRIQILSAPRYYQYNCKKKDCNCAMHCETITQLSPKKPRLNKKLIPISNKLVKKPDDMQSEYKVRTKTESSLQKVGKGLLGLLKSYRQDQNNKIKAETTPINYYQISQERNIKASETEPYSQTIRIAQKADIRADETSYIQYLQVQSDKSHHNHINISQQTCKKFSKYPQSKTVQIQTLPQNQFNNENTVNVINNNVQVQVSLEEPIQQKGEESNIYHQEEREDQNNENLVINNAKTQTRQDSNILLKNNIKNKKNEYKYKKLAVLRSRRYEVEQNSSEEQLDFIKQQKQNNTAESKISSSVSMTMVIANGLNESYTQFKQLVDQESVIGDKYKASRAKSTKQNGTFVIPSRKEYSNYLRSHKTMDSKIFSMNKLVKSELFKIVEENDSVFFGEIQGEDKQGMGLQISEKQIFEGVYEKNQKIKGSERNIDGIYRGYFINGNREGYGTFQWNNGEKFEGNWSKGVKEGFGIWRSSNGDYYQGEWHNNRQSGQGTYKHKNSMYKGQFLNFLKHGKGQQKFVNDDNYCGNYQYGKPDGKGTYTWHNGSVYIGDFKNGLRSGSGKWIQKQLNINGISKHIKTYEGQFQDDHKWGKGKQTQERSGDYFEGQYIQGIRVNGILYDKDGNIKQQITLD